jgi:glutathione synthase/RimK-type ligase-like ATP-grasp enzyme
MALRTTLGDRARLSRLERIPRQYKWVINWGNPEVAVPWNWGPGYVPEKGNILLNKPGAVRKAINKLTTFAAWKAAGVPIPEFCGELQSNRDGIWLARTTLTGSGGEGIVVIRKDDPVPAAALYVKYIKKEKEFRAHVVNKKVIFVQQKKRSSDAVQDKDQKLIRNHDNGWVFCPLAEWDKELEDAAVKAVDGLGLDYGAVDMVLSLSGDGYYCLECNTAPGIESPTLLEAYKEAFLTWLQ